MSSQIQIKNLNSEVASNWDDYVSAHPKGSFFHLTGWQQVIEQSFQHPCFYLYAEVSGKIVGVDKGF